MVSKVDQYQSSRIGTVDKSFMRPLYIHRVVRLDDGRDLHDVER